MRVLLIPLLILASWPSVAPCADSAAAITPEQERYFEQRVRPLLVEKCQECHGAKKQQGGLRLDSREAALKGNDSGPAFVPGKPDESRLVKVIQHAADDVQMPPQGKLPAEAIATLTEWVRIGAPWPSKGAGVVAANDPEAWRKHWAFQPMRRPAIPAVKNRAWPANPVDAFIAAKLESAGRSPSPAADPRTLLRRVSFDLTGIPPTYDEAEAFANDRSPTAYAAAVERLLASPRFGERWGRHWLDVARYADTKGYVFMEDRNYADAWRYRDWVIAALNDGMPYDRFLTLQLAADRVAPDDAGSLAAMGYLTLGRRFLNNTHDIIDDRIDVVTRGLMGFTVTCARCHDHKYDPIPAKDYYSLYGVFASSQEPKDAPSTLRLVDAPQPFEPVVFVRGNPGNHGDRVPRQFLGALDAERRPFTQGSGRQELAQAITSPTNPLTARVFVNRVWAHLFGKGFVTTPSDFGVRSDPPTHPELLDWLAAEFAGIAEFGLRIADSEGRRPTGINSDSSNPQSAIRNPQSPPWDVKRLLRTIVLSQTYRQSSNASETLAKADPENRLFGRQNRRRLEFESQRDALLAATGDLDERMGGPSVPVAVAPFTPRRTIYGFIDRQNLPGLFRTFDLASPDTHAPQRFTTTVPQQALFAMNHPFVIDHARRAARGAESSPADVAVSTLYRRILARSPSAEELRISRAFLTAPQEEDDVPRPEWAFGYGAINESTGQVESFTPLPHWTGTAWQGGPNLPDPTIGWALLTAQGGHPGESPRFLAIRRWTAPEDANVRVNGDLKHPSKEGDGVRARIVWSRAGLAGTWTANNSQTRTPTLPIDVRKGETLDFVVDGRTNINHDSFQWTVKLSVNGGRGRRGGGDVRWDSVADFHGPSGPAPTPLERLAHVLLMTNEFVYVD